MSRSRRSVNPADSVFTLTSEVLSQVRGTFIVQLRFLSVILFILASFGDLLCRLETLRETGPLLLPIQAVVFPAFLLSTYLLRCFRPSTSAWIPIKHCLFEVFEGVVSSNRRLSAASPASQMHSSEIIAQYLWSRIYGIQMMGGIISIGQSK